MRGRRGFPLPAIRLQTRRLHQTQSGFCSYTNGFTEGLIRTRRACFKWAPPLSCVPISAGVVPGDGVGQVDTRIRCIAKLALWLA
jgi:hypothetical protein